MVDLFEKFPDEQAAIRWLENERWPDGERCCFHCGSTEAVQDVPNCKPMPYRCGDCKRYFSLRTGTAMERRNIPLQKWLIATFLLLTHPKGVSSVQLAKDLGIQQKSAWFLGHRSREGIKDGLGMFGGPVEVDEVYLGGKEKNKHWDKKLKVGGRSGGKTPVMGVKNRETNTGIATPVESANRATAEKMIGESVEAGAEVFTDTSKIYGRLENHETVNHSKGEYVRGAIHTNGIKSFWALLKRGDHGTYHWMSPKHMHRYVNEFTGRYNSRGQSTLERMAGLVGGLVGKRLTYRQLVG